MLNADLVRAAVETYGDMLYRICIVMLKNQSDAEDAVQDTFMTYIRKAPQFDNSEHEKAWLITVASNKCRDVLRYQNKHRTESEDKLFYIAQEDDGGLILEALSMLPEKFRIVLTLYYIEEYKVDEIADIIGKSPSAVKMRLQKGRRLLAEKYRKDFM